LPTGAGEARTLEAPGLVVPILESAWLPDDRGFYFVASEPGHRQRTFRLLFDGSQPTPVTEEGYAGALLSPDAKSLVVSGPENRLFLYDLAAGKPRPVPGSNPGETCLNWDESGRGLYLISSLDLPAVIERLDLDTGRHQPWKTIKPSDLAGAMAPRMRIAPKGDVYTYSFERLLSDLYLVEGLR